MIYPGVTFWQIPLWETPTLSIVPRSRNSSASARISFGFSVAAEMSSKSSTRFWWHPSVLVMVKESRLKRPRPGEFD